MVRVGQLALWRLIKKVILIYLDHLMSRNLRVHERGLTVDQKKVF